MITIINIIKAKSIKLWYHIVHLPSTMLFVVNYCVSYCKNTSFGVFIHKIIYDFKQVRALRNRSSFCSIGLNNLAADLFEENLNADIMLPENRIIKNFDKNKPSILIIDDSKGITSIVEEYLSEHIPLTDYNVLTFFGVHAGFVAVNTLRKLRTLGLSTIDYAILDIIMAGRLQTENGGYLRMDGIDVANIIRNEFGCTNLLFFTGNTMNYYVEYVNEKITKFENIFKCKIHNFLVFKNDSEENIINRFGQLFKIN